MAFGLWTLAFGVAWGGWRLTLELDFGLWTLDFGSGNFSSASHFGLWTLEFDFGFWIQLLVPPPILDFGLWNLTLDFGSSN